MIWEAETVYTLWGYIPRTTPAVVWSKLADGNWAGADAGTARDIYMSDISFQGPADELETLEDALGDNRDDISITCGVGEEIFGAEIDYSAAIDVAVVDYGKIKRVNFGLYSMPLTLRLLSPSSSGAASLAALKFDGWSYEAGSEFDTIKHFAHDGTPYYLDAATDPGYFSARFRQSTAEMVAIRRYLLTTARTATVAFPSLAVTEPFGKRTGSGPFTCKIIQWADVGRVNYIDWAIDITFSRVI